jgi:hypothetical protein
MSYPYPALPKAADDLAALLDEHGWQVRRDNLNISGGRRGLSVSFYQHQVRAFRNGIVLTVCWERDLDNDQPYYKRPYPLGRWAVGGVTADPGTVGQEGQIWIDRTRRHVLDLDTLPRARRYVAQDPETQRRFWDERVARNETQVSR